ncbi:MAG TPA: phospholipase D-like domain-containing protein [Candidatus Binatia bacterium]|nr:phospholipase D-like domain-containing protein [Candidatus Binatia bacterium]
MASRQPEPESTGAYAPPDGDRLAVARPGRNCWRVEPARRVAFLVDGADYFRVFAAAAERARRSIRILGWDLNTNVRLRRSGGDPDAGPGLARFLDDVAERNPDLRIDILSWDFAAIYAFERELFTTLRFRYRTGERVRLELDAEHPVGASHHQKVVVIDDAIAFVGGLDLTINRWDTREHRPDDRLRADGGTPYSPFHDVQIAVDGAAARALGDLVRWRWQRATGEVLDPADGDGDPWPDELVPDVRDVHVAIARTQPAMEGQAEIREIERLFLDSIAAARRSIFIENQYLTSAVVGDALAARLEESDGPDVVIVGPWTCSGWLEEATMGVLRGRLVARLRAADRHGRLRLFYPTVGGDRRIAVNVHSKVMIVDDVLVRVGSANLSNRSMGLDTECDVAIDADADARARDAIARFRSSLLGEHLGVPADAVDAAVVRTGSLARAVDELRAAGGDRTLVPFEEPAVPWLDGVVPDTTLIDPDRPLELTLLEKISPETSRRHESRSWTRILTRLGRLGDRWARWTRSHPETEANY